jgi:hypothetical protein
MTEETPRLSKRGFIRAALGTLGVVGTGALVANTIGFGPDTRGQSGGEQGQQGAQAKAGASEAGKRLPEKQEDPNAHKFATAESLLGPGYKTTRLDAKGAAGEKAAPYVYDIKAKGQGFAGSEEQTGAFYLAGKEDPNSLSNPNVSMQVSLLESQDGSTQYLAVGVDNSTSQDSQPKFVFGEAIVDVTSSQREGTIVHGPGDKLELKADQMKGWRSSGETKVFMRLKGEGEKPTADNVMANDPINVPDSVGFEVRDTEHNTSIRFDARREN